MLNVYRKNVDHVLNKWWKKLIMCIKNVNQPFEIKFWRSVWKILIKRLENVKYIEKMLSMYSKHIIIFIWKILIKLLKNIKNESVKCCPCIKKMLKM